MKQLLLTLTLALASSGALAQSPADVIGRDFHWTAFKSHLVLERFVPRGAIFLVGDSLIQNMESESLNPRIVNFGIGGDTSAGVLHRLKQYQSIKTAKAVFLESGVNDLGFGAEFDSAIISNYAGMLDLIPTSAAIYMLGIFPVDETVDKALLGYNVRIRSINQKLTELCSRRARCVRVDLYQALSDKHGNFRADLHNKNDGVHYNDAGRQELLRLLRKFIPSH